MNLDEVPPGLVQLLRDFTLSVLRNRPSDLHQFAADYFGRLRNTSSSSAPKSPVPMYVVVDDDEDAGEPEPPKKKQGDKAGGRYQRRKSICGESYNPEDDDDVTDSPVVYPKSESQRQSLTESVSGIILFRCLDADQTKSVVDAMFEKKVTAGDHVIEQNDDGDFFYVIQNGTFDVMIAREKETKCVARLVDKGYFGELALLYNTPRAATIVAVTDGVLWAMDRKSFKRIVLRSAYVKRKTYEGLLESVPMLVSLNSYERMSLADALMSRFYSAGDCIIREGDAADGMYFIEDGEVRVTITKKGRETEVSRISKGKYFGEMALVENAPRSATVYAVTDRVKVAFLERESFERMLGPCLDIMKRKMKTYQKSS